MAKKRRLATAEHETALNEQFTLGRRLGSTFGRFPRFEIARRRRYESRRMFHDENIQASALQGLVDAALGIARKRQELLTELRAALESKDTEGALKIARQLCGLEE
jgi:hypothetical protein